MRKRNLFYIISAILLILIPLICYSICSTIINNELGLKYDILTIYESEYYLKLYFWWVFLAFTPICLIFLLLSLRDGKKTFVITFFLLILVLCIISFKNLSDKKQFTTSYHFLYGIEDSINYKFSNETFALFQIKEESNSNYSINYEGLIRLCEENDSLSNIKWYNDLDEDIKNYLPEEFEFSINGFSNYFYSFNQNDDILVLAYSEEYSLIYCISIKL